MEIAELPSTFDFGGGGDELDMANAAQAAQGMVRPRSLHAPAPPPQQQQQQPRARRVG